MTRAWLVWTVGLSSGLAFAQSPVPADPPGTVSAEAVEMIVAKPDQAKVTLIVAAKAADAKSAEEEVGDRFKELSTALDRLKLKGMTVVTQPSKLTRAEAANRFVGGGNGPPPVSIDFRVQRTVLVTLTDADPALLVAAVDKVQQEAAKAGAGGEPGSYQYNGWTNEQAATIRVTYSLKAGWDDLATPALTKAAQKAKARAEAMASGLGLALGEVVSVGEPQNLAPQTTTVYNYAAGSPTEPGDEFVNGELRHKVRVRVTYTVRKK